MSLVVVDGKIALKEFELPFRGGTLRVSANTTPGNLAIIAQLSLADPRLDAFYLAAEVQLTDPEGRVVFPVPEPVVRKVTTAAEEMEDLLDLFGPSKA